LLLTYENVLGVFDGSNDPSSEHELFPGLADVDDMNSFSVALEHVRVHEVGAVLSSEVGLINSQIFRYRKLLTSAASIRARSCSLVFE
jgi:hypothetical protein